MIRTFEEKFLNSVVTLNQYWIVIHAYNINKLFSFFMIKCLTMFTRDRYQQCSCECWHHHRLVARHFHQMVEHFHNMYRISNVASIITNIVQDSTCSNILCSLCCIPIRKYSGSFLCTRLRFLFYNLFTCFRKTSVFSCTTFALYSFPYSIRLHCK